MTKCLAAKYPRSSVTVSFLAMVFFSTSACRHDTRSTVFREIAVGPRIVNLRALAHLYGVVRRFHPSDAAAAADWDQLAIDGAHMVADAPDCTVLRARLSELFTSVAPTIQLAATGEKFRDGPSQAAASTSGWRSFRGSTKAMAIAP